MPEFAIVDLFAGPGGLAEGFSSIRNKDGSRPFRLALSVEKETSAFETLRLRNFLRQFDRFPPEYYRFLNEPGTEPDWLALYPEQWKAACRETVQLELGSKETLHEIDRRLTEIARTHGSNTVLIGGPPCQAYSLVGRARNKGNKDYEASKDPRHFLYREYIRILQRLMPAAFVMENVKGLLSSSVDGELVFERVLDDLSAVGDGAYTLVPIAPQSIELFPRSAIRPVARDFVVRAEHFGIPQSRHRVIVLGIRSDITKHAAFAMSWRGLLDSASAPVLVRDVLKGMPKLRSGLTDTEDSKDKWRSEVTRQMRKVAGMQTDLTRDGRREFRTLGIQIAIGLWKRARNTEREGGSYASVAASCPAELRDWLVDGKLKRFPNHETRGHMSADLGRYFFAALYAKIAGQSPKAGNFPSELAPDHRNWRTGKFADRFRVQLWDSPATTITSHISKDGHYFIHPDPAQCRSLTVREAARLQTFPDNYFFEGNRTQQFVQVGNAVPPLLARKIAMSLIALMTKSTMPMPSKNLRKVV